MHNITINVKDLYKSIHNYLSNTIIQLSNKYFSVEQKINNMFYTKCKL